MRWAGVRRIIVKGIVGLEGRRERCNEEGYVNKERPGRLSGGKTCDGPEGLVGLPSSVPRKSAHRMGSWKKGTDLELGSGVTYAGSELFWTTPGERASRLRKQKKAAG